MQRIIAIAFGAAFGGIGLSLLGFMWLSDHNEFGTPPLFFRVFASFMAIPFVAIGGATFYSGLTGNLISHPRNLANDLLQQLADSNIGNAPKKPAETKDNLDCPHCGSPTGDAADISPSGDVKCGHCRNWYSVRSQ